MSRGNAAANVTAAGRQHVRPIFFAALHFDSGTLRLHNGIGPYTWGGQTWTGMGALVSVGPMRESDILSPQRVSFVLGMANQDIVNELASQAIYERLVYGYVGFLDDRGNLVADPDLRWSGYMDTSEIIQGANPMVVLHCESELIREFQANGAMFTDEDQQERYSGDTGFEYMDQMALGPRVQWGPGGSFTRIGRTVTPEEERELYDWRSY